MRFFEFQSLDNPGADDLVLLLRNISGRASSKNQPSTLNWGSINNLLKKTGDEVIDYDAFKSLYDSSPVLQKMVHNFNANGIELNVPGVSQDPADSQDRVDQSKAEVNKIAASAAAKNIA
jgi:hypothetical protein